MNRIQKPQNPSVLIAAPNASTEFGGEAILPVHYFRYLRARGIRACLVAHQRNRANLEEVLHQEADNIFYVADTAVHKLIWKTGSVFPAKIRDHLFGNLLNLVNEVYQARLIRRLVSLRDVTIIHQPTPVSPKAPSSVYGFGVPVVIGPDFWRAL